MSPARHKRLGHKKSRNGCLRCKARRVKCDEKRPCGHCIRHGVECSLVSSEPPPPQQAQTPVSVSASPIAVEGPSLVLTDVTATEAASPQQGDNVTGHIDSVWSSLQGQQHGNQIPAQWMQSLLLMQHYCNHTYKTLSRSATEELWKETVPKTACQHEFLMHGLLAVSALHYAHMYPQQHTEYIVVSTHYQSLALRYFADRLSDIDEENCEAYFYLASFIFTLSLCHITHPPHPVKPLTPDHVCQAFMLLQGVKGILDYKPLGEWRQRGPLASLLQSYDNISSQPPSSSAFTRRLDKISTIARELPRSMEVINEQSACILALESLRTTYQVCAFSSVDAQSAIWSWPITLPLIFIEMLGQGNHIALIILAHFAAYGRPFEHRDWVSQGWSRCVIDMVERELDQCWHGWIQWPKKSIDEEINVEDMAFDEP
ncbi:hypothetical protein V2G26_005522 [Clonostachys chloroleuca]